MSKHQFEELVALVRRKTSRTSMTCGRRTRERQPISTDEGIPLVFRGAPYSYGRYDKPDMGMIEKANHACGADDVEGVIPADVQIYTLFSDRQHNLRDSTWRYIWWHAQQKMYEIFAPICDLHVYQVVDSPYEFSYHFGFVATFNSMRRH
jgi:hypothetical protein